MEDLANNLQMKIEESNTIFAQLDEELQMKKSIVDAAVEASKRAKELEE